MQNMNTKIRHLLYADKGRMDLTRWIFTIFDFCTNGSTKGTISNWIGNVVV